MLFYTVAITALGLSVSTLAAPHAAHQTLHEKRSFAASNRGARVDPDSVIPVRIALKQNNLDLGEQLLMDVSHPDSKNYGKHLSAQEVHDFFSPSDETVDAVRTWLVEAGVDASRIMGYQNKGWLSVDMPVWEAEELLSAEYYEHHTKDGVRIGADEYSLPGHISAHIDYIRPGVMMSPPLKKSIEKRGAVPIPGYRPPRLNPNRFLHTPPPLPPAAHALPPDLQHCGVNITPACVKALYKIPAATDSDPANVMGLYESGDAFAQQVCTDWVEELSKTELTAMFRTFPSTSSTTPLMFRPTRRPKSSRSMAAQLQSHPAATATLARVTLIFTWPTL